jgi:Family of unknown function (DUF5906)
MSDARNQFHTRDLYRRWQEATEPDKRVITMDDIGLDFDEKNKGKPGNPWDGFVTRAVQNDLSCDKIELFIKEIICSNDDLLFDFLMCCIALPIKNPGERIHIGVIIQSDEGLGKGVFGEILLRPFGRHGIVLNQHDLEDRFNAHEEDILMCIFEEIGVGGGREGLKLKNTVKHRITGDTKRINPKQINGRMVRNRTNYYFFTNELLPFELGNQARRWFVLKPKTKRDKAYYTKVIEQIRSEDGANGWHFKAENYLSKNYPNFTGYEDPPETEGKAEMVELSQPPALHFWREFVNGELNGIPHTIGVITQDLYDLFVIWCRKAGYRWPPPRDVFIAQIKNQTNVGHNRYKCTLRLWETTSGVKTYKDIEFGQPSFILPPNHKKIPTKDKAVEIGKWVLEFRSAMEDYK